MWLWNPMCSRLLRHSRPCMGEVMQLCWAKEKIGDKFSIMSQKCDHKMRDFIFERDGQQVSLDSTAPQLSGGRNSLTVGPERFEQHHVRSAASQLRVESLLLYIVFSLLDWVTRSESEEIGAHCPRPTGVVSSASDSLELDS